MAGWSQDVRFGVRALVRRPLLTAAAVWTVAVGVGSATAVYSVVDGVLLRPLGYAEPDRLVTVWQTFPHWRGEPVLDGFWDRIALPWESYVALRDRQTSFESVGAYYARTTVVVGLGEPDELVAAAGSASLLGLLGATLVRGRWFDESEEGPHAPRVAVLSHEAWRGRLGGADDVLGRTVRLDGEPFTIIGVLSPGPGLRSLHPSADARVTAVWRPIGSGRGDLTQASNNYEVLGRLGRDVRLERAAAEVEPILRGERDPSQRGARVLPRLEAETGRARTPLLLLLGAVGLLLVLACANVAALLLGEAAVREREVATRAALGASRWRVARQLLTESVVLAACGGALGIVLAVIGTQWLLAQAPAGLPRVDDIGVDVRVLAFCLATTLATGVLFGLAPALSLSRSVAVARPGGARATLRRGRVQSVLVAAQLSLCVVLLFAAGLLGKSLLLQSRVDPGLRTDELLVVRARLAPGAADPLAFYAAVRPRLRALGDAQVTLASHAPLGGSATAWSISIDPDARLRGGSPSAQRDAVLPGYFEVLGIPLLEGRPLRETDGPDAQPVVVVNETMARRFWPGESALGRRFRTPAGVVTVVGVSGDVRHQGLERASDATFYMSLLQVPTSRFALFVRTSRDARALATPVRSELRRLDAGITIIDVETMDGLVSRSLVEERYRALLLSIFGAMATLIAVVGVAGVTARAVAQQLRELCIRMAVGASPRRIVVRVLLRGLAPVAAGVAFGGAAGLAAARALRSYLFDVRSSDPVALGASMLLLVLVMAVTLFVQARRAVQPNLAAILRAD